MLHRLLARPGPCGAIRLVLAALLLLALASSAKAQAPPTPTGVAATPADQAVSVAWLASTGATSYNLYRSLAAGQEGTTPLLTGITGLTSTNTGLANGTRYYYKVSAVNASGESALSSEVNSISGSPSVPGSLSAIPGNNQVSLFWNASSSGGASTTYSIYVALSPGGEGSTASVTGIKPPSWGHYGATNGTTYYYQVTAKNAFGESGRTPESAATPAVGVPAPPAGLSLTPSSGQIALAWSPVSTATSYKVYRALAVGGPFTVIGLPSSTSFTNTGLTNGATYWYYLTAVSSFGESSASGTRSGVSNPAPPAPAGLSGTPGIGSVTLSWTASTGAASYNLYRSTDGLSFSAAGSTTATSYLDSPLSQGTPYWYYVSAVGPTGSESGLSNEITITTSSVITVGACGPVPPQGWLYVSTSTVQLSPVTSVWMSEISLSPVIKVQWNPGAISGCNPHYQWSRTGGGTSASGDTVATSFRDGFNFTTGTTYTYSITAVSDSGSWSTAMMGGNLWYYGTGYTASNPVSIQVTPQITSVTDNQTADARYDLRFGNPTFLDYPFATGIYKGGLYVGNATDPSRMGRSFLRFTPPGAGSGVWAGSISAYFTGSFTSVGNIPVGCQGVLDNGWTPLNLKWSTAPALTPTAARNTSLVTYSTNNPIGY